MPPNACPPAVGHFYTDPDEKLVSIFYSDVMYDDDMQLQLVFSFTVLYYH
jgi:hypothetical protein